MLPHRDVCEGVRKPLAAARRVHRGDLQVRVWQAQRDVMNDTVATEDQEQPADCHERKARVADRDPGRRTSSRPADICSAPTGRTYDRSRPNRSKRQKSACQGRPFSNRLSLVNGFVAAPGHGSLRGRNNPPQHLVRSTGAAMSTTSRRAMTPLNGHPRSHPYPRPAGNHHIRVLSRMKLANKALTRR